MIIHSATFIKSAVELNQAPTSGVPEYAFIGRSNVGKSSLINMLTGVKGLAKTSQTPGKTRQINYFQVDNWRIADLPGYGYARLSKTERASMEKMIQEYVSKRDDLICLFLLIDSRIPPQRIDLEYMRWLAINSIPFVIVLTKIDKLSSSELVKNLLTYKKEMLKEWETLPDFFQTSATSRIGKEQILSFIENFNVKFAGKSNTIKEQPKNLPY
jgi:GTP-binding protein